MGKREEVLRTYLKLMKLVDRDIREGNADDLEEHSRTEELLICQLESLQKAIRAFNTDPNNAEQKRYEETFRTLCTEALEKNRENQSRMRVKMDNVRKDLTRLKRLRARTGRRPAQPRTRYIDIER